MAAAVAASRARFGPAIVGICLGLAVNFKIHAFAYFLPILADAWGRGGWRALACATGVSCTVFAIPFLLPGISFGDYASVLVSQVGRPAADGEEPVSEFDLRLPVGRAAGACSCQIRDRYSAAGRQVLCHRNHVYFGSLALPSELSRGGAIPFPASFASSCRCVVPARAASAWHRCRSLLHAGIFRRATASWGAVAAERVDFLAGA